jgi:hypothetical protein
LTSATIYNFKGDFLNETTEETTFVWALTNHTNPTIAFNCR